MPHTRRAVAALLVWLAAALPAGAADWDRYQIVMWHTHGAAQLAGARRLGVTAAMAFGVRDEGADIAAVLGQRVAPARAAGLGVYVGNIATDFYAAYHRWQPDHPLTWLFDQARARHRADPADMTAFIRTPSLSDPAALARIVARLRAHVGMLGSRPLYYSLGDETGIADLTAAWDFDFSPASLAAMRVWLRGQYGALAGLNAEWGTSFATWDAVRPPTTDAALRRTDGNFSAWMDFKAWMDVAFARAVRAGTDAVHAADRAARAAIEGAQLPGWGGYDYTLLAGAVDVMEISGGEPAQAIAQALNPALVTLTTVSGTGPAEAHELWRAALEGGRGAILWDPDAALVRADGTPGPRWPALAGVLGALGGTAGTALLAATPQTDAVAILYSPASFRLTWLLDRQAAPGQDWSRRTSEDELADNALRVAMRQASEGLAHLALHPRWVSPALLAAGGLRGVRVLILPHALALSDAEVAAIRAFAASGGTVLADIPPGGYDAHGRRRAALPLAGAVTLLPGLPRADLRTRLAAAGVAPWAVPTRPDGTPAEDVTMFRWHLGAATLLGVQRDFAAAAPAEDLMLTLPRPMWLRTLGGGVPERVTRLALRLDAVTPALLDVTATR